jgi:hypothetical protein
MEIERAIAFIQKHGDAIDRARLAAILFGHPPGPLALRTLAEAQRPDGGFAAEKPSFSTVAATAYVLYRCDDMRYTYGPLVTAACQFLLQRQCLDGGWDEVGALRAYAPPAWQMPGRLESRLWLTGCCSHILQQLGYHQRGRRRGPSQFLLAFQDRAGAIGDERSTWLALPTLAQDPGPGSRAFAAALEACERAYGPHWTNADLAWMLRCLLDAGVPAGMSLVRRALVDLEARQGRDGGWDVLGDQASTTLQALRVFKGYGMLRSLPSAMVSPDVVTRTENWRWPHFPAPAARWTVGAIAGAGAAMGR